MLALNLAVELVELEDMGILPLVYREGLNAMEVAVMRGAHRGNRKHEDASAARRRKKEAEDKRKADARKQLSRES